MIGTTVLFEAAHRQWGDPGKCGKLHGHNWKVVVSIDGAVNNIGYVVDFKDIKDQICEMDHKVILHEEDPLVDVLALSDQRMFLVGKKNPTCENLAELIVHIIMDDRPQVCYCEVTVWENDVSWSTSHGQRMYVEEGNKVTSVVIS